MTNKAYAANTTPVAVHDCHQLLAWIIPQLELYPRARRFTLGEKLEVLLMEVRLGWVPAQ
ncbi:four helix bundle protein [Methylomonas rhizoryzae]|uniref:hypothetical protein n=1 Tax=Methylomonas rhizoryzae TaxID=2608981 RepID=UPI0012321A50|nr:hypothetical protein [Methylomonas rhizoryzae]